MFRGARPAARPRLVRQAPRVAVLLQLGQDVVRYGGAAYCDVRKLRGLQMRRFKTTPRLSILSGANLSSRPPPPVASGFRAEAVMDDDTQRRMLFIAIILIAITIAIPIFFRSLPR